MRARSVARLSWLQSRPGAGFLSTGRERERYQARLPCHRYIHFAPLPGGMSIKQGFPKCLSMPKKIWSRNRGEDGAVRVLAELRVGRMFYDSEPRTLSHAEKVGKTADAE